MNRPIQILLVEDNPADADLLRDTLEGRKLQTELSVVTNGEDAISFLKGQNNYKDVNRPDLILLDLIIPRKDGKEVLKEIKTDEGLRDVPVVILTSSSAESDVAQCYGLGADGYVMKPVDFKVLSSFVKSASC